MLSGSSSDCLCFFYRTEDKACHNNISHSSSRRAAMCTHSCTHTQMHRHTYGPTKECLYLVFSLKFEQFTQSKNRFDFFSPQGGVKTCQKQQQNGDDHSHFLTELTVSLPRSEIGGSEKHTIRNHYSAPN